MHESDALIDELFDWISAIICGWISNLILSTNVYGIGTSERHIDVA